MSISLKTEDNIEIIVDKRIELISKLFETLIQNYNIEKEDSIYKLKSNDVKKLINFCEIINYKPIKFEKPFCKFDIETYKKSLNDKTIEFYNSLDSNKLYEYALISDFFEVESIDELIYLKLYEIYQNKDSIINYFKDENKEIVNNLDINEKREKFLYDKYKFYIKNQLEKLSDEDLDNLGNKFLK